MQKLKKIGFTFENCEGLTIDSKYIGTLDASNITNSIRRVACNSVIQMQSISDFAIEIHKNADIKYDYFQSYEKNTTVFDRFLLYADITKMCRKAPAFRHGDIRHKI